MAYDIILKSPQEFTASNSNELYYQFWKADPPGPIYIKHFIGAAAPDPILINFQVRNHFVTDPVNKYSAYYLNARLIAWTGTYQNMLLTGDMVGGEPGLLLSPETLQQDLLLSFQNLGLLSPGKVNGLIEFYVNGVRTDSGLTDRIISSYRIYVEIEALEQSGLMTNKEDLVFTHIKEVAPLPGRSLGIITADNFRITLPKYFMITGGNVQLEGEVFPDKLSYTGSGNQTVMVSMKQEFDFFQESVLRAYMEFENLDEPQGEFQYLPWVVKLTAYLVEQHGFVVNPPALEFFLIKGIEAPAGKEIEVTSSQAFVVAYPFWLQVSPDTGENNTRLLAKPISADNLISGEYNGVITLTSNDAVLEVPVQLKVVESINEAFSRSEINFTGDNLEVTNLYSDDPVERASLELGIMAYDYKGFGVHTSHPFYITFFEATSSIHIGDVVSRKFKKINALADIGYRHFDLEEETPHLFRIFNYYKPAAVDVSLKIESRLTGFVRKNKKFNGIKYIPGRRPQNYISNYGILNYDCVPVRVTRNSQATFNFMRLLQDHEIKIYRNNVLYKTVTHTPGTNSLFGMAMYFKDFTPGDVIEIKMGDLVQKYAMFPDGEYSNHIVFMNEYHLLESFEFTGKFTITSDYESTTFKSFKNLVEYLEKLETPKEQMLIINSGWILKSNQVIMDAIIRSRRVWFVNKNKEISLTGVSKKIVNEDSDEGLYQYDLEFKINRANDLEVYTS